MVRTTPIVVDPAVVLVVGWLGCLSLGRVRGCEARGADCEAYQSERECEGWVGLIYQHQAPSK